MQLYTINTGYFKLDGGAMFGVVPKNIWHKLNPADDNNMIRLAMRCLLIQDGKRLILIDNGIGEKQDEKFFSYYFLHGDDSLEKSLMLHGFSCDDITDVVLSHLHFDHCGGSIKWNSDKTMFQTTFKNACYWVDETHWAESQAPNAREKASFLRDNILPINESGQLRLLKQGELFHSEIDILYSNGHTQSMIHPIIPYKNTKVIYLADVIPTMAHIPTPYVMGYDVRPLDTMVEKQRILKLAVESNYVLFFEHDPFNEACTVHQTEKGIKQNELIKIAEM
ncbi:MAG: MBL fold metallo-hydrolase [Bacteroidetes bacterium]|nr:MBL fold metallo-hydrolase [Bacteroidota bacterium]